MSTTYSTSATIELCSPSDPYRIEDSNRQINLRTMLPSFLKETEVEEITEFFENFLNTLYDEKIYATSATPFEIENRPKIGILEKIKRLVETHDSDYVDLEYIQTFANYLGYNVDLNYGELGVFNTGIDSSDACLEEDSKRYLRFVVENLPNWYKIKTTEDSVKIMLYSFGIIGDLIYKWTNDYKPDNGSNWISVTNSDVEIPSDFYPTPHFNLLININESITNLQDATRKSIVNAINSIRPVNTVFDNFLGYSFHEINMKSQVFDIETKYCTYTFEEEPILSEDGFFEFLSENGEFLITQE